MSISTVHYSSKTCEWSTPQEFFDKLDAIHHFTLDVCANHDNAKCARYFTEEDNGLLQDWSGETVWMNPPYGRTIGDWVKKAYMESQRGAKVVCLLPARTDTRWWHDYCQLGSYSFVRGRLKFGGHKHNAPFPCAIVIFERGA